MEMKNSPLTKTSFHKPSAQEKVDRPDPCPPDANLKYIDYITANKKVPDFTRKRSKTDIMNDKIGILNENRFWAFKDISDWNSKYESQIGHPFLKAVRNTDIPGTKKNTKFQKNGPDHDIFIDCNPDVGKRSLTLGMVDMSK